MIQRAEQSQQQAMLSTRMKSDLKLCEYSPDTLQLLLSHRELLSPVALALVGKFNM